MHNSHICLKSLVFASILLAKMVRSARELFAIERMAARGPGSKKITEALGVPLSTTKRWLQRLRSEGTTLGDHRGTDVVFLCSHPTLELCVV